MNVIARPSISHPSVSALQGGSGQLALYDRLLPANKPLGTVLKRWLQARFSV
jgi:hypothetical protein